MPSTKEADFTCCELRIPPNRRYALFVYKDKHSYIRTESEAMPALMSGQCAPQH
jgi:hypothetical protein